MRKPRPVKKQALDHVAALTGSARTVVCIQPLHDSDKSNVRRWFMSTVSGAWQRVLELQELGFGIFLVVNETDGKGRTTSDITRVRAAFIDCDDAAVTLEQASEIGPPCLHIARDPLHSHYYWRANIALSEFRDLQKRLAAHFNSDPSVCDLPRVMRLAGTLNLKGAPKLHRLISCDRNAPVLSLSDFKLREPVPAPPLNAGERNAGAYKFACSLVNRGLGRDERLSRLGAYNNEKISPPLPCTELRDINIKAEKYARGGDETGKGLFADWAWVSRDGTFREISTLRELAPPSFDREHNHHFRRGSPSDRVTRETLVRKFEATEYDPGAPRVIERPGALPLLNLYRPPEIEAREGCMDWFFNHLEYLIPDRNERGYLIDWLMFAIKHPGRKIHHAVLLQGRQGTGKSFFKHVLSLALGAHNVAAPGSDTLADDFTAWLEGKCLIIIEELLFRGRWDVLNRAKYLITEPAIYIRRMRSVAHEVPNRLNLFATTNHRSAIRLDGDDRRWLVIFSPAEPRAPEYYRELFSDLEIRAAALRWHAENKHDFSAFDPHAPAPRTRGRKAVIEMGLSAMDARVRELFEGETEPFHRDLIIPSAITEELFFNVPNAPRELYRILGDLGAEPLGRISLADGKKTVWAIRDVERWLEASATEIREFFSAGVEKSAVRT